MGEKFTPGPWQVEPATINHGSYITAGDNRTVCDLYVMTGYPNWKPFIGEDATANANLIAAAPELYVAATDTVKALKLLRMGVAKPLSTMTNIGLIHSHIDLLETAIAKARGEPV